MPQPLKSAAKPAYQAVSSEDELEDAEQWGFSPATTRWLIALGVACGVAMMWFFCFFLPSAFVPEARNLTELAKVRDLAVHLVPVDKDTVRSWNLGAEEIGEGEAEDADSEAADEPADAEEADAEDSGQAMALGVAKQRLILVGDIHGQEEEFLRLLRKVRFHKQRDALLVLGDFISKGPSSLEVVDDLIDMGAKCILGNHEYYALQNYARFHHLDAPAFAGSDASGRAAAAAGFDTDPEFLLAKKLQPRHIEYINSCPMIMDLGAVPLHAKKNTGKRAHGHGIAVHAGLRWDVASLDAQSPDDCLEMRAYLKPHYRRTTSDPRDDDAYPWYKYWNQLHKNGTRDDYVVYYGHDAGRGLNIRRWSKGLDNGCYGGNRLAAMVMWREADAAGRVLYKEQVVQVKC